MLCQTVFAGGRVEGRAGGDCTVWLERVLFMEGDTTTSVGSTVASISSIVTISLERARDCREYNCRIFPGESGSKCGIASVTTPHHTSTIFLPFNHLGKARVDSRHLNSADTSDGSLPTSEPTPDLAHISAWLNTWRYIRGTLRVRCWSSCCARCPLSWLQRVCQCICCKRSGSRAKREDC